jgi:hypothetical protein
LRVFGRAIAYQVEGKSPVMLNPDDVLFIPAGTAHAAKNVGSDSASELATYIVKGKPLLTLPRRRISGTANGGINSSDQHCWCAKASLWNSRRLLSRGRLGTDTKGLTKWAGDTSNVR